MGKRYRNITQPVPIHTMRSAAPRATSVNSHGVHAVWRAAAFTGSIDTIAIESRASAPALDDIGESGTNAPTGRTIAPTRAACHVRSLTAADLDASTRRTAQSTDTTTAS